MRWSALCALRHAEPSSRALCEAASAVLRDARPGVRTQAVETVLALCPRGDEARWIAALEPLRADPDGQARGTAEIALEALRARR